MSQTPAPEIPVHKRPESCFVCGRAEHPETGHRFWSNADAFAEADARDRRMTFVYPSGATNPEGAYVDEHRPR